MLIVAEEVQTLPLASPTTSTNVAMTESLVQFPEILVESVPVVALTEHGFSVPLSTPVVDHEYVNGAFPPVTVEYFVPHAALPFATCDDKVPVIATENIG